MQPNNLVILHTGKSLQLDQIIIFAKFKYKISALLSNFTQIKQFGWNKSNLTIINLSEIQEHQA